MAEILGVPERRKTLAQTIAKSRRLNDDLDNFLNRPAQANDMWSALAHIATAGVKGYAARKADESANAKWGELFEPDPETGEYNIFVSGIPEERRELIRELGPEAGMSLLTQNALREPTARWEEVRDEMGNVLGQRNTQTGEMKADPRASTARPVSVSRGGVLVDPRTGQVIYQDHRAPASADGSSPANLHSVLNTPEGAYGVRRDGSLFPLQNAEGDPLITYQADPALAGQRSYATKSAALDATRMADFPKAVSSLSNAENNLDRLAAEAQRIMHDPALERVTGVIGMFPSIPGGAAANVEAKLETLRSQVGFGVLQAMRDASQTGGALGQVSNIENVLLQNNLAALSQAQSADEFRRSLQQIVDYADKAKVRLRNAFVETYPDLPSQSYSQEQQAAPQPAPAGLEPRVPAGAAPAPRRRFNPETGQIE